MQLPRTHGPTWSSRALVLVLVAIAAIAAATGFGVHRPLWPTGLLAEIGIMTLSAAAFAAGGAFLQRRALIIALVVVAFVLMFLRLLAGMMFLAIAEPISDINTSAWIMWALYPGALFGFAWPVVSRSRSVRPDTPLAAQWTLEARASGVVLATATGGLLAVRGLPPPLRETTTALLVGVGILGGAVFLDRIAASLRVARLVEHARRNVGPGLAIRAATSEDDHVPAWTTASVGEVVVCVDEASAGGPFRAAREERALVRVHVDDPRRLDPAIAATLVATFLWAILGLMHAATALDPARPPPPVAMRFEHMPVTRLDLGDPVFAIPGHSLWSAPAGVVSYEEATGTIDGDTARMLAMFAPTSDAVVVARRAAAILHICTLVAPIGAADLPVIRGGEITYRCARQDSAQTQTFTDPIAPQRYRP